MAAGNKEPFNANSIQQAYKVIPTLAVILPMPAPNLGNLSPYATTPKNRGLFSPLITTRSIT